MKKRHLTPPLSPTEAERVSGNIEHRTLNIEL
jgi:hypothetical protein